MIGTFSVVLNAHARSGDQLADTVRERWAGKAAEISLCEDLKAFEHAVDRAKRQRVDNLIVGGGDGTIRQVTKLLLGSEIRLGILPLGTGNALAHELGIPIPVDQAMEFFDSQAVPAKIDVGIFNGEPFVNIATIGITSKIMQAISQAPKGRFGRLVYVPALFRAVRFAKSFSIRVETEQETIVERAVQFVAASSQQHGGPFNVTESASICDGRLSIYVVKKGDRASLFRYGLGLLTGRHTELPTVWSTEVSKAKIALGRKGSFVLDGDSFEAKHAELGIEKGGLNALVSPDSAAAKGLPV